MNTVARILVWVLPSFTLLAQRPWQQIIMPSASEAAFGFPAERLAV
jgi:hypothetical protein